MPNSPKIRLLGGEHGKLGAYTVCIVACSIPVIVFGLLVKAQGPGTLFIEKIKQLIFRTSSAFVHCLYRGFSFSRTHDA